MSLPSLRQLEYLVALADVSHFRKAAERVHVSQPTLSGQIKELEQRLGVSLVERTRHFVHLTPVGKAVADRARGVLREVENLCDLARTSGASLGGTIRLGVPQTLGPYLLPYAIPTLRAEYPGLRLYVGEDHPRALERALNEGVFDLLLTTLPAHDPNSEEVALFRETLLVGVAWDHPLTARTSIASEDLKGQAVLSLGPGHRLYEQVQALCEAFGATLISDYEGTSLDALRQMVGMGMGISFFPVLYVRSEMDSDHQVVALPLANDIPLRTIGLVWRGQSPRAADFRLFGTIIDRVARTHFADVLNWADVEE
jgi:LysR family hydrogen peroxide-inducible transcriptional activator